jgi:hypothetical protein
MASSPLSTQVVPGNVAHHSLEGPPEVESASEKGLSAPRKAEAESPRVVDGSLVHAIVPPLSLLRICS